MAVTVKLSPFGPKPAFLDSNGNPLVGGKLWFYIGGSSTPQNTYTDSTGGSANADPVILNSRGEPTNEIWFIEGATYKAELQTAAGVTIWTVDNITAINDTSSVSEWKASGLTPTFVSATSFTLSGDQTSAFHVGRRLKSTNTAGTVYSTISASSFAASTTTVTVVNDSGVLDSGLSAVSYSLLSASNPSTPLLADTYPIVSGSADQTKKLRLEVDGLTTATTRVLTVQDKDMTIGAVLGTKVATTSGTSIDFTAIPSWVTQIAFNLASVSTNGTSVPMIQIGDSGGVEVTGYTGSTSSIVGAAAELFTTGFALTTAAAQAATVNWNGTVILTLEDETTFTWNAVAILSRADTSAQVCAMSGLKATSAALDRVRLTTAGGADTFDAGSVNIRMS